MSAEDGVICHSELRSACSADRPVQKPHLKNQRDEPVSSRFIPLTLVYQAFEYLLPREHKSISFRY